MSNQSQQRPWFRLGSMARPVQPGPPPPAPASAPRPQMQPPVGILSRPSMIRPAIRPPVAPQTPQASQDTTLRPRVAPPPQVSQDATFRPRVAPQDATLRPPVTPQPQAVSQPSSVSPAPQLPHAVVSPVSTPKNSLVPQKTPLASPVTRKSPPESPISQKSPPSASPVTRKSESPLTRKSPLVSPVTQNAPASPLAEKSQLRSPATQKSPFSPRASPETRSLPPSILSSTAIKQDTARSMLSPPPMHDSPPPKQVSTPTVLTSQKPSISPVIARMPTPVSSPRGAKPHPETPPESPKIKSVLRSPPLFSLPPSQIKSDDDYQRNIPAVAEQKTMRRVKEAVGRQPERVPVGISVKQKEDEVKKSSISDDIEKQFITISGENRGAIMELGHSSRGTHQKLGSEARSTTKDNENTSRAKLSTPMHAFTNSNVQGINSSIVFNSTISHHDPGVHLSLARKPRTSGHMEHENDVQIFQKKGVEFRD